MPSVGGQDTLSTLVSDAAEGSSLKQMLLSSTVYGNAVLTHCLAPSTFKLNSKVSPPALPPQLTTSGQVHTLLNQLPAAELVQQLLPLLEEADALVQNTAGVVSKVGGFLLLLLLTAAVRAL